MWTLCICVCSKYEFTTKTVGLKVNYGGIFAQIKP